MVLYLKQRDVLTYAIQMTIFSLLGLRYTWFSLKMNYTSSYIPRSFKYMYVYYIYILEYMTSETRVSNSYVR